MKIYTVLKQLLRNVNSIATTVSFEAVHSYTNFEDAVACIDNIKIAAAPLCNHKSTYIVDGEYCSLAFEQYCPELNEKIVEFYTVEASELI